MQYSTRMRLWPLLAVRMHLLVVVSVVSLALLAQMPDSVGLWETHPPAVYAFGTGGRGGRFGREGRGDREGCQWRASWQYLALTWPLPVGRGLLLALVWLLSGQGFPLELVGLPEVVWISRAVTRAMPFLGRCPEWTLWLRWAGGVDRWTIQLVLAWALVDAWLPFVGQGALAEKGAEQGLVEGWAVVGCSLGCTRPTVTASYDREGHCYRAEIKGQFSLAVADDDPFRVRLLVLFLRLLEWSGEKRGSRRTRDGRRPFVRQQELGRSLGIVQPDLSRWEKRWTSGDWRGLLSQQAGELLTRELQQKIIDTWAHLPMSGVEAVHRLLLQQGLAVTESQVRQAAHESGWQLVRGVLSRQWAEQAGELRLREGFLVGELLRQIEFLLGKVEGGERLTAEEQLDLAAWRQGMAGAGLVAPPPVKPLPWLMRVEQVVFGHWEALPEGEVRCIYCGSDQVVRKSRKPRYKQYLDAQHQLQVVPVYRYYCRNRRCGKGSFTDLPPGLVPYSRQRTEVHLLALQAYAWGYSNYRRAGASLGVTSQTAYRWVSAWGQTLLPVAALFGVVRSSGVVGVDEKYVLVPKNDKPAGKMRRWMYVYFAVDAYTYDLLHLALFPHNNEESAQAFLLALRAKGYHPRVVVTDLRQDYGPVLARVFPKAEHHECLFHALQNVQQLIKGVYGGDYAQTYPEAVALKQSIYEIFDAKTKRTAQKRYGQVLALREEYVQAMPGADAIFAFLERHWPKLVNAIESDLIPSTNNTVELVIRRFDQHYQNFCGFQSIQSAALFLGVFEKLYRFTPFSQDAQPALRGKSPLQLAGYDLGQLPMASLCSGLTIIWRTEVCHVPNS